jgi:purine-binding chemotaxis protein CheW
MTEMTEDVETPMGETVELVAFRIGEQEYCIDIMSVREIRGWTQATMLPHAPSYVQGVINLRGTVLPIVDLSARLGLGACEPTARHVTVVITVNGQVVGLLVDAVSDILTQCLDGIRPAPDTGSESTREFVKGVFAVEERMISLIELEAIVPDVMRDAA